MSKEKKPTLSRLSLFLQKREESKTPGLVNLTNKNWARLFKLTEEYNITNGKEMTIDEVLNSFFNTYYYRAFLKLKKKQK